MNRYLMSILVSLSLVLSCSGVEPTALQTPTFIHAGSSYQFLVPTDLAHSMNALASSSDKAGFMLIPVEVVKSGGGSWFQIIYHRKAVVGSDYKTISEAKGMTVWFNLQNVAAVYE